MLNFIIALLVLTVGVSSLLLLKKQQALKKEFAPKTVDPTEKKELSQAEKQALAEKASAERMKTLSEM